MIFYHIASFCCAASYDAQVGNGLGEGNVALARDPDMQAKQLQNAGLPVGSFAFTAASSPKRGSAAN